MKHYFDTDPDTGLRFAPSGFKRVDSFRLYEQQRIQRAVRELKNSRPEGYMEKVYTLRTQCALWGHVEFHPGKCGYCGAKL